MPYRAKAVIVMPYRAKSVMPYRAKAVIIMPYGAKTVKTKTWIPPSVRAKETKAV